MSAQLTLNLDEGSVSLNFTTQAAQELQAAIAVLMERLKATTTKVTTGGTGRVNPQTVEYRHTGDVFFEIFCNPNIWPSPFAAKVLVTVRDERIRLTTEVELTRLIEDLDQYLRG